MGSVERSKKKVHLYKNVFFHFLLCFVLGFFTGFVPSAKSLFSSRVVASDRSAFSPQSMEVLDQDGTETRSSNRSLLDEPTSISETAKILDEEESSIPRRLIIVITPTSAREKLRLVNLRRLGNTLKLVPPPLLWVVVEQQQQQHHHHHNSSQVSEALRKTGIMYRHLVFKENFTDPEAEMDHQRNLALTHIEHHRLSGIVHFAGLSSYYDLSFFDEIRAVEVFGAWPMAFLSVNRKKVRVEGPICDSEEVVGWHLRKMDNLLDTSSFLHISSFAFNSSILWDPERWGRSSSVQDTSQNTIKFIKKEVLEEDSKLIGIPAEGCSKILLWNVHVPKTTAI
ncbi:beta-1,4-xylosyltransferase IRX9-like [Diospyros lotus]|uniref:beta-1,4-xylosyltransferase IRX9-like n=1 Tax=Diospyros lotus TaxID=55363 RepID=UPI0022563A76|nr:beta-1,4-xylosyltransferase IRX9-like [Diospyros lotus]